MQDLFRSAVLVEYFNTKIVKKSTNARNLLYIYSAQPPYPYLTLD